MRAAGRFVMQRLIVLSILACPTRAFVARRSAAFLMTKLAAFKSQKPSSVRFLSSSGTTPPDITHIGRAQMEEIVEDYVAGGREDSQYCIIDVRTEEEVYTTGQLGEGVYTLPVQVIMQAKVFEMEPEAFEEFCGFEKPTLDETLVFSCAAGIRSVYACQFAAQAGYTKIVNYTGGSNEWFSPSN